MINHHDYDNQDADDANCTANGEERVGVPKANDVRSGWDGDALKADVRRLQRNRRIIDRRFPVAMRSHTGDEKRPAVAANSYVRTVCPLLCADHCRVRRYE